MRASNRETNTIQVNKAFDLLIKKLEREVDANLNNEQFGVEDLAEKIGMSRSNLHRKLQQATGQSVSQFIREYRLHRALECLENDDKTISEVAHEVGFGSPSYFTSCFTEYFGYAPSGVKYKLSKSGEEENTEEDVITSRASYLGPKAVVAISIIFFLVIIHFTYQQFVISKNKILPEVNAEFSIAVLPFKNLSADRENEYFCAGVVGSITTHLAGIQDLKVISRISADKYGETIHSVREIGDELHVSHLLEGSIQRHQNTVRIEVRLIDAGTEGQIWAESYDRELSDILNIQSEIAQNVVLKLKSRLSKEENSALTQYVTESDEAYDLYLKGWFLNQTYSAAAIDESAECFRKAIALDSGFALAYAGLGGTYVSKACIFADQLKASDAFSQAKPLLEKALEMNPNLDEGNLFMGFYYLYNNWDFVKAEESYLKAIGNNHPDALAIYADFLNFTRRHEEALVVSKRLDKFHPHYPNSRMIPSLFYLGKFEAAEEYAVARLRTLTNFSTLDMYGFLMLNTGNYSKAIELFQETIDLEGIRFVRMIGWMGAAYARSGQKGKAVELIEELEKRLNANEAGSIAFYIAVIYAALHDNERALHWLDISVKNHEMEIPWLKSEPQFYHLHDLPAFRQLLKKTGFPSIVKDFYKNYTPFTANSNI